MQLLDTDLTQNEVKTDSEVGSLFLKPNKLGATVEKEASTTFALCVEEPLRYFSVWAVPPGTAADDYMSARTFQFTEMPSEDTILTVLGGDWERKRKSFCTARRRCRISVDDDTLVTSRFGKTGGRAGSTGNFEGENTIGH